MLSASLVGLVLVTSLAGVAAVIIVRLARCKGRTVIMDYQEQPVMIKRRG